MGKSRSSKSVLSHFGLRNVTKPEIADHMSQTVEEASSQIIEEASITASLRHVTWYQLYPVLSQNPLPFMTKPE